MKYDYDMIWNGYTICPEHWGMEKANEIFHRIYYVYGGEAYCTYGEKTVRLEPGKLYLFPIMQPYTMWHNPKKPLDVLWFHVEMKLQLCMTFVTIKIEKSTVLESLLEAMRGLSNAPEYFQELLGVFSVFLSLLGEKLMIGQYPGKQMNRILEYIDNNIGENLSVATLANEMGMERSYFSRKFKSIVHTSPNQYIMARKMNVAAKKLMAGASIYQSASAAGYTDEKAFSRAFKSYMELSPAKYRSNHIVQP